MQPAEAVELIRTCKNVLEHWNITYMQVCRRAVCVTVCGGKKGVEVAWREHPVVAVLGSPNSHELMCIHTYRTHSTGA